MRYLSVAGLRWAIKNRAWTPWYLIRYFRLAWLRLRHPEVVTQGMVFLGRRAEVGGRPGYGRVVLGRWVHIGDGSRLRAHEGTLRIGDKVVFGSDTTVNCYLDVEIGARTLVADWVYVTDFDHRFDDIDTAIKDQGIVKSPVRVGPDCWLGAKVSVLRGAVVGQGCVIGAHAVVRGMIPDFSVAGGVPAKVLKNRLTRDDSAAERRPALSDSAGGTAGASRRIREPGDDPPTRV